MLNRRSIFNMGCINFHNTNVIMQGSVHGHESGTLFQQALGDLCVALVVNFMHFFHIPFEDFGLDMDGHITQNYI